jgi:hypothetical protein
MIARPLEKIAQLSLARRFGFNPAAGSPKHVPKIERWRCIGRIAFHHDPVEALVSARRADRRGLG